MSLSMPKIFELVERMEARKGRGFGISSETAPLVIEALRLYARMHAGSRITALAGMSSAMKIFSNDIEEDYALFGKILLLWGIIEMILLGIAFKLADPNNKRRGKGFQLPFAELLKLVIQRYKNDLKYAAVRQEGIALFKSLIPLHARRTIIVHGAYQGITGQNKFRFLFAQLRKNKPQQIMHHDYSRPEVEALLTDLEKTRHAINLLQMKS